MESGHSEIRLDDSNLKEIKSVDTLFDAIGKTRNLLPVGRVRDLASSAAATVFLPISAIFAGM